jgi:hypothetical protein
MAVTSAQIVDFLLANPGMTDDQIVKAMEVNGVSPAQMAQAVGLDVGEVVSRVAATVPSGQSIILGDTRIAPQYQIIGSGEDQQIGGIENVYVEKVPTADVNYKSPVGTPIQVYSPTGEFVNTIKTQKEQSFFGGLIDAFKDPVVLAALAGGYGAGLFGGAGALGGAAGTVGTTGLTMAELAQLDLALGGAGGTLGAETLAAALTTGAAVPTLTNLTGGSGVGTLGVTGANGAFLGEGVLSGVPAFDAALANATVGATGLTAAQIAALTAQDLAIGGGALAGTPPATIPGLLTPAATTTAATTAATALTPTALTPAATATTIPAATTAATLATTAATTGLTTTQVADLVKTGLTTAQIANLFSSGATTAAGLLQQQTSKEAAQKAQAMIDRETAAAKQAAQFRPIGMTTRFGASQFGFDPVTGQLTSAGYTLSPEAKNAQDRFVRLAESGIQQAEGAQQAFAPLQTGAQSLFGLGNQYLAQNPQDVAQNYLNQQMALLQPGRELELANLQNRLQQQGRGGLSVAQGGALGATTPELQALYNARAQQEAQLAANAQQYGQQNVLFGAGLLGQGSQAMGQYYGGQQAAYAPYTTALGQVQGLETAAQQPFQLGVGLGKETSTAGYNVGRLGLTGAGQSVALATGADATRNPYASAISGLAANPALGQYVGGLFSGVPPVTAMSAPATTFGTGTYYGNQDLMSQFL